VLDTDANNFVLHRRGCTAVADIRRHLTHIYFVANNNRAGDGIPTLKRAELGAGQFTVVPLVEGIENLQVEYGFKNGGNLVYTPSPDGFNGCAWAGCVAFWRNVSTAKVHLLARNLQSSPGYKDSKTYTLGEDAAGNANTFGPFNDAYRRHAYSAAVRLTNPALRLQ
jgi:type IV pilus assembly protein PilW